MNFDCCYHGIGVIEVQKNVRVSLNQYPKLAIQGSMGVFRNVKGGGPDMYLEQKYTLGLANAFFL